MMANHTRKTEKEAKNPETDCRTGETSHGMGTEEDETNAETLFTGKGGSKS